VSAATYREAVTRLRAAYAILGPRPSEPCGLCGYPDSRHRVVDAITERLFAGDDPGAVADDYALTTCEAWELAAHVRDADHHRHRVTLGQACGIDREVWGVPTVPTPIAEET